MGLSVLDVLRMPNMTNSVLLAGGDGLERSVRSVTVLDAPDALAWLSGHEFVLTSTYPLLAMQDRLDRFVEQLATRNVAALAVKLNRYLYRLPDNMIRRADELGLPIVSMDPTLAWIEVIHPIVAQSVAPAASGAPAARLPGMPAAGSSRQLADWLFTRTGKHGVILNAIEGDYAFSSRMTDRLARQLLATIADESLPARVVDATAGIMERIGLARVAYIELNIDGRFMGYAAISHDSADWQLGDLQALVEVRTALPATLLQQRAAASQRWQTEDEFIRHLIDPDSPGAVAEHMQRLGRELLGRTEGSFTIAIVEVNARHAFPVHEVNRLLRRRLSGTEHILGIVGMRRLAIVVPDTGRDSYEAETVARLLQGALRASDGHQPRYRCAIGISQGFPIVALDRAFRQAEQALDSLSAGAATTRTRIFEGRLPEALAPGRNRSGTADAFIADWIGPILSEPPERAAMLVNTLQCFLAHCGNHRRAARELGVHHNTVRYRIGLLEKLLRRPLLHPRLVFNHMLAVEMHRAASHPPS